ncbi:MAG: hypothetical protein JJV94_06145 [Sulfurospirillum sp.]|nr:hypothetical protein [Sulfurospirillum sp.]
MKIKLFFLIIFTTQLFSLTIVLNSAKFNDKPYAILHIKDSEPVDCKIAPQSKNKKIYLCKFNKIINTPIESKEMPLVTIDFLEKKKEFYVRIEPKVHSRLVETKSPLYLVDEVSSIKSNDIKNQWSIFLYDKIILGKKPLNENINFPIHYPKNIKPYIGALDLNGAPISYVQSKDIELYVDLKENFKNKKYNKVANDSIDIIKKYPNTIFKNEFILYRLKAIDIGLDTKDQRITKNFDPHDIIKEGKAWMKLFPSDSNIPEILMLIAKSYLKIGFKADANYFMDILISEYKDSLYTKKAILIFADSLYNNDEKDKAIKLYLDVLYSVQDLDVAAEAAIRLSDKEMNRGKTDQAKTYLLKVLEANHEYLLQDIEGSYRLAKKLASNKLYDMASKVSDTLLHDLDVDYKNREEIVKNSGLWHAKANEIQNAHDRLKQYLEEYKYGIYRDEVQASLDELFFELNETNETKLANYYDVLIDRYPDKIGKRALVEKSKLLLSQKKYKDVLGMDSVLKSIDEDNKRSNQVLKAASALVVLNLKDDTCTRAISYMEKYSLKIEGFDKSKLFNCLITTSRFKQAKKLSEVEAKNGTLEKRNIWMQKHLLSLYKLNEHERVLNMGEDIVKMSRALKIEPSDDTLEMIFFSLVKLDKFEKAIDVAKRIEKSSGNKFKNSDIYIVIVKKAEEKRDDLLLSEYANKIISLQKKHKNYIYTPAVELSLIAALQRLGKIEDALVVALDLLDKQISNKEKIRVYYNAGELSMKLNKNSDAKKYFEKCKNIKAESSWKDICKQNLSLL